LKKKLRLPVIFTLIFGNNVTEDKMVGHVAHTGEWEMYFENLKGRNQFDYRSVGEGGK
jgi:hypothetical protein